MKRAKIPNNLQRSLISSEFVVQVIISLSIIVVIYMVSHSKIKIYLTIYNIFFFGYLLIPSRKIQGKTILVSLWIQHKRNKRLKKQKNPRFGNENINEVPYLLDKKINKLNIVEKIYYKIFGLNEEEKEEK